MRTDDLPIVDCSGTARQRGQAHGETLRVRITERVGRWLSVIGEAYGILAAEFLPRFLAGTDFRPAVERYVPYLGNELRGIAEGAGIDESTAYAMQLMDEEWWFGRSAAHHCSSVAIAPEGGRPTLVGQTMDLPLWQDGTQALLRFREEDGSDTIVFTSAGMIGLMGVSGRGLGVCVNTLNQLGVDPRGLPVAFVMRGALATGSPDAAARFLQTVPHASGQNYQLGGRHGARTFECSAGAAAEVRFIDGRSLHTNHPLASGDRRDGAIDAEENEDSRLRLESLHTDLSATRVPTPGIADVKTALSACRSPGAVSIVPTAESRATSSTTVGSVVFAIGDTVSLSVCAGPPSQETWREIAVRSAGQRSSVI